MPSRLVKQIIIALIFLFILAGSIFLVYYFKQPAPSCSDNIQNQGEEGIDCGGPCLPCIVFKEIEVLWTEALPKQDNFYDLAAQIKNPNQNHGSGYLPYHFEVFDSADNLIADYRGSTFILPNQTKYLVRVKVAGQQLTGQIKQTKLSFGQINWERLKEYYSIPQLVIQQKEYYLLGEGEPGFSQARGILVNESNFDFDKTDIDILLFDPFHNLMGLNTTEVRALLANEERDFVATWFEEMIGQVSSVEIEAETNVYDPSNYLSVSPEELEQFQEY